MRKHFIIALILAIAPFALLSAGQAIWRLVKAHEAARDTLVAAVYASPAQEANILTGAEPLLRKMETQEAVRTGGPDCALILANAIDAFKYVSNMSRLDAQGRILCSARPIPIDKNDRSGQDWWKELQARQAFIISKQHRSALSGRPVLTAAIPLLTADGAPDGALALGISIDFLGELMRDRRLPDGALAALIDKEWGVVASSDDDLAGALFAPTPEDEDDRLKRARDDQGRIWLIALAPVGAGELQLAFAEREAVLFAWSYVDVAATIVLPLVMAAVAFVVIWYAANRYVLRWIWYLERVARAYGKGHFALKPAAAASDAPPEIRTLARAMGEMAENIRQRDASLRHALDQRTLMLREIHHRVKNNLQIVGSLLQIEARGVTEPAAREALRITQTRINAIALAHRALEEVDAQTFVNVQHLLTDLGQLLSDAFSAPHYAENVDVVAPPLLVETDIAVPLALLLVEQISAITRDAVNADQTVLGLSIHAVQEDTMLRLVIGFDDPSGHGVDRKMSAFGEAYLKQLRGSHSVRSDGQRAHLDFRFPYRTAFAEAGRHA